MGKIEKIFFIGYYSHPTESTRTSAMETHFTYYCLYPTENSKTNAYDNCQ